MSTKKEYQSDKLQKNSILFLQLGLVLALFIVYGILEFETEKKEFQLTFNEPLDSDIIIDHIPIYVPQAKEKPLKQELKKQKLLDTYTPVPDDLPTITDIIKPPSISNNIDSIIRVLPGGESAPEEVPSDIDFIAIEEVPIFPGCEGLEKKASKICFTKSVSKFVNKKFNSGLAEDLNLTGKHRIWVLFKIDKYGIVTDIRANSTHRSLEKEAIRVVEKLPQMIPGKQQKRAVGVKYALPIVFIVD